MSVPRNRFFLAIVAVSYGALLHQSIAGPLTSAEVTKIINRVSVIDPAKGGHPAALRDVIKDDLGLQTGAKSRSELLFQDNTLTRIGAETFFSFKTGTRDMTLEKGSMLLQVPKGLGGASIHTAAVTAAITGTTIMMEYIPHQYLKVLVLEGSLRLSRNGSFGNSMLLTAGKMVIMRPDAKTIPEPVDVDLNRIVETSPLVNFPGAAPLPSTGLIQAAIGEQSKQLAKGILVPTNLLLGQGTRVVLAANDKLAQTDQLLANTKASSTAGLKNAVSTVGSGAMNASGGAATAVNSLLGSGPAVSVSNSTQLLSLVSNATPASGGTITVTPTSIMAGANTAANAAGTATNNTGTGVANPTTLSPSAHLLGSSSGSVPTLLGQTPIGSNPYPLTGSASLPGQNGLGPPPGH